MLSIALTLLALNAASAPTPAEKGGNLVVRIENLRSVKGVVQLCLTANPARFPDCKGDPGARTASLMAKSEGVVQFRDLPPGAYAVSAIHDENGNGKLDTLAMMPKEGFGFSRNPAIGFGPPKFAAARFTIGAGPAEQHIKMRYLL